MRVDFFIWCHAKYSMRHTTKVAASNIAMAYKVFFLVPTAQHIKCLIAIVTKNTLTFSIAVILYLYGKNSKYCKNYANLLKNTCF